MQDHGDGRRRTGARLSAELTIFRRRERDRLRARFADQMMPHGIRRSFGAVGGARLAEHARDVNGDRVAADAQCVGDFLVGPAEGQQSQDFQLATGQPDRLASQS